MVRSWSGPHCDHTKMERTLRTRLLRTASAQSRAFGGGEAAGAAAVAMGAD